MLRFFGKKVNPEEKAKEWRRSINHEIRELERQIKSLEREEAKVTKEIKSLGKDATRNQKSIRTLARQLVMARNAKNRMYEGKAQLHSVQMQLNSQLSLIKVSGVMKKSTEIMAAVGKLVKIPELQQNMFQLATEMERAGLVEEIVSEGLAMTDAEGLESEVDKEVDAVVAELTAGLLEGAVDAPTARPETQMEAEEEEEVKEDDETAAMEAEMKARLESL